MVERGERRVRVLGLILRLGDIISRDLIEDQGLTHAAAATELARYQRQGLLHRDREPGGPGPPVYRYRLTWSGEKKVRWLIGQARLQAEEQEHLPGLEPEPKVITVRPTRSVQVSSSRSSVQVSPSRSVRIKPIQE